MNRVQGKVVLVTGGNSGIGKDAAKALTEEGAVVYITARREDKLEEAASEIGGTIRAVKADVTKKEDMLHVAEVIREEQGHLDAVFINAGAGRYIKLEDSTEEDYRWTFDCNVWGAFNTMQAVLGILSEGASVILNTSVTKHLGLPEFSLYAAAKAAMKSLIYSWTADLKDRHIRVNALSPGVIPTAAATGEFGRSAEEELAAQKRRAALTPLGRVGDVRDTSNAVLFLVSDESSYIAATEIAVDGGLGSVFPAKL